MNITSDLSFAYWYVLKGSHAIVNSEFVLNTYYYNMKIYSTVYDSVYIYLCILFTCSLNKDEHCFSFIFF